MGEAVAVTWEGVTYASYGEAARALKVTVNTVRYRHMHGYTSTADMRTPPYTAQGVVWNGTLYGSITEAAKANYLSRGAMQYRLRRGFTCDEDMG